MHQLYVNLLTEVAARISFVEQLLNNETNLGRRPAFELCHLQMRLICELISIGCLAAHGDISPRKLHRNYEADFILNSLERLHPKFFPVPVKATETKRKVAFEPQTKPAFDKAALIAVYRKCGDVLHRGKLDKIGMLKTTDADFRAIRDWPCKTRTLINSHLILLKDGSTLWAHIDNDKTAYFKRLTQMHK